MANKFNPNAATFEDGVIRVSKAMKKAGLSGKKIVTSQDKDAIKACNLLATSNVPNGFKKWQLPIVLERSQMFISIGNPDVVVPEHSHNDGDGVRVIVSGSVYFKDKELKAGDWMYIPKGQKYSIKIGPMGAAMCYCYCCCCAGKLLNHGANVINPNPNKG